MKRKADTIRFWHWWGPGPVKLTLRLGVPLELHHSEYTDEGHSYEHETLTLFDGYVECDRASGGCDCDGPIHRYTLQRFDVEDVKATPNPVDPDVWWPGWEHVSSSQRDVYAEAMGY